MKKPKSEVVVGLNEEFFNFYREFIQKTELSHKHGEGIHVHK